MFIKRLYLFVIFISLFSNISAFAQNGKLTKDERALLDAAKNGKVKNVERLLKKDININVADTEGAKNTALIYAAGSGHKDVVKTLVDAGADINARNEEGETAIIKSVFAINFEQINGKNYNNYNEIIDILINENANLKYETSNKQTALMLAPNGLRSKLIKKVKDNRGNVKDAFGDYPLIYAASKNDIYLLRTLISERADINQQDEKGDTALMIASFWGRYSIAKALIDGKAKLNITNKKGDSALKNAVYNKHYNIADALIKAKADLNIKIGNENLLLYLSKNANNYDYSGSIRNMITAGVDVNARDENGNTALINIVSGKEDRNQLKKMRAVISGRANVNIQNKDGLTALMLIASSGNESSIRALISAKPNMDAEDKDGNTALIYAVQNNNVGGAKAIIRGKPNLNKQNKDGNTALMIASENGLEELVRSLISAKANLDMQNNKGDTALLLSVYNKKNNVVKILIDAGADINIKNKENKDILAVIRRGYDYLNIIEIVSPISLKEENFIDYAKSDINGVKNLLNDKSINIDAQNKFGDTALIKASFNGQSDIVSMLLEANAGLNFQDNFGHTALIDASRQGYDEVAKQLIDAKANLNIQNIYGKTALILASLYNHSDIVKLLVDAGANKNIKDNDGKTALMYAREKGYSDIVNLLR